jgi:hypothetical protein
MFEREKLAPSMLRTAAMVAGAAILAPFCAFADSVPQISLTPASEPLILVEGGNVGVFILTVENVSKPRELIGIKNVSVVAVLMDGTDKSDTIILPIAQPVSTCPKAITLAFGNKCTVTFTFTTVAIGPPTKDKENLDSGITSVRFRADPTLGPMAFNDTEILVNDVGFSAIPEPATWTLFTTGVLGLAALEMLRRGKRKTI